MILRRLGNALKGQDWTTVFIEFVLIFASVILALQFDNWNTDRQQKKREREVLSAIAEDLQANIETFKDNMAYDENSVAACEKVIETIKARGDWTPETGAAMGACRWWSSPYLYSAAYTGLKSSGTELISNPILRRQITRLYENDYNYLVNDTDRAFWDFQAHVMMPLISKTIRPQKAQKGGLQFTGAYDPIDYKALLDDAAFLNMLYTKQRNQKFSIADQQATLDRTREVLNAIEAELKGEDR